MVDSDWGPVIQHGKPKRPVPLGTMIRYGWQGNSTLPAGRYQGIVNNSDEKPWRLVVWYQVRRFKELDKLRELIKEPTKTPLPAKEAA